MVVYAPAVTPSLPFPSFHVFPVLEFIIFPICNNIADLFVLFLTSSLLKNKIGLDNLETVKGRKSYHQLAVRKFLIE